MKGTSISKRNTTQKSALKNENTQEQLPLGEFIKQLKVLPQNGLTQDDIEYCLYEYGYNELK